MAVSHASKLPAERDASRPEVLLIGPYPAWDVEPMEREYARRRLWEAADRDAFLAKVAPGVRAGATRGQLGAGAAHDVFWNEPDVDPRLLCLPHVLVQPHQLSGAIETRKAMGKLVRDNLAAHFAGRPLLTPVV